jgi:ribokinase
VTSSSEKRLVCIGDVMQDITAIVTGSINFDSDTPAAISTAGGGAAGNVAAWAAHAGHRSAMIGKVGDDAFGAKAIAEFEDGGVECFVTKDPEHSTGIVVVLVPSGGSRTMFPDPGANAYLRLEDLIPFTPDDLLYISGYAFFYHSSIVAVEAARRARAQGIPVAIDPASSAPIVAAGVELSRSVLSEHADIIIANEDEAFVLTGFSDPWRACEDLSTLAPHVVIKLGAAGAIAMSEGKRYEVPAVELPFIVDTTGAGDSFAGGFLPVWAATGQMEESLQAGVNLAAACVARIGARP